MLEGLGAGQPFLAVGWVPAGRIEGAIALRRAGPIDRHRFQSFEMPGRQLEGVCPYLLEEVAPAGDRCRVGWGHHHSGKGHQALLPLPPAGRGRQGEGYFDERLGSPEAPTEMPTAVVAVLLQDSEAIEGAEAYHFVGHRPCSCL